MRKLSKLFLFLLPVLLIGCFSKTSEPDYPQVVEQSTFKIPADLQEYYKDLTGTTDAGELRKELRAIITNYDNKGYNKRHLYLYKADADLQNPKNVVLMYTGEKRDAQEYMGGGLFRICTICVLAMQK